MIIFRITFDEKNGSHEKPVFRKIEPTDIETYRREMAQYWHEHTGAMPSVSFMYTDRAIRPHELVITEMVCEAMQVTIDQITSFIRYREVVDARAMLTMMLFDHLKWNQSQIGRYINHPQMAKHYLDNRETYHTVSEFSTKYDTLNQKINEYLTRLC